MLGCLTMIRFLKYLVVWVSQNLSIPFWVVGHVHLTTNVYEDIYEIITSFGLNIIVATGFIIEYFDNRKKKKHEVDRARNSKVSISSGQVLKRRMPHK